MKVQATKTMTKAINDFLKENGERMRAIYETMSRRAFEINVDFDFWDNERDYLPASDKMRAVKIVYPVEYYAMPRYLTSAALVKLFRKSDKSYNGFMREVLDEISI